MFSKDKMIQEINKRIESIKKCMEYKQHIHDIGESKTHLETNLRSNVDNIGLLEKELLKIGNGCGMHEVRLPFMSNNDFYEGELYNKAPPMLSKVKSQELVYNYRHCKTTRVELDRRVLNGEKYLYIYRLNLNTHERTGLITIKNLTKKPNKGEYKWPKRIKS